LKWSAVLLAAATLLYPALVYLILQHHDARVLVLPLALLAVVRFVVKREWIWGVAVLLLALLVLLTNRSLPVKLYPVAVSLSFLAAFAFSLIRPPSFVERMARLREPHLPPQAVRYTRCVTLVWCAYFLVNAVVAAALALWGTDRAWALYCGGLAYLLAGLLFAGEYILRQRVRRKWQHA